DGIRYFDFHVTGVQTCALPISSTGCFRSPAAWTTSSPAPPALGGKPDVELDLHVVGEPERPEERRVRLDAPAALRQGRPASQTASLEFGPGPNRLHPPHDREVALDRVPGDPAGRERDGRVSPPVQHPAQVSLE